ncbi:MAG: PSD1 domain-containing protein [Pirellulaceae bacterium]|nr:PSD1 domain-containing protein [Pirellulaceae bacterium]
MLVAVLLLAALPGRASAEGRTEPRVDFASQVYPILKRACIECHGPEKQEGDLRLDQRDAVLESGLLAPGEPSESELLRRISLPRGADEVMPARGDTLPPRDIATLRRWIEQGADWPAGFQPTRHWAYVAPVRPAVPRPSAAGWTAAASGPRTPIDAFVWQRLRQEGLQPSPPAEPAVLVRRVFLDLIGLPPSPEEVDRFLADPSERAYERLVDDLLRRPQFGERWARPWLDVARYADSHGFQRDDLRDIWAYRDWVIRALNDDLPFDRFTIEQLAGDLLPGATIDQRVATGFHRCAPTNVEAGSLPEETRIEQVIDRVNTTGAVWLGTTLECAQCHDHKYDPFTMRDYYGLLAFFNNTEAEAERKDPKVPSSIAFRGPSLPLPDPRRDARRRELEQQLASIRHQQDQRREQLASDLETWAGQVSADLGESPQTHPLEVVSFESTGTTDSYELLDDGSVLLVGDDPPERDVYTVRVRAGHAGIRALRLDALTHHSLPGEGPGRGDARRPNFILNEFTAEVVGPDPADRPRPLRWKAATADFSQARWDVRGAIDGDPKSGWAINPQFGRPHWALFLLEEPLDASAGMELTLRLEQQYGAARTIGRLRFSAVTGDPEADSVPAEVAAAVRVPAGEWTRKQRESLLQFRAERDVALGDLQRQAELLQREQQQLAPDTTLVMVELDRPRQTAIFQRGDYRQPGELLEPAAPSVLHPLPPGPLNRLTLARWLVDPANPLVARVTVNRWWAEIFGQGLVETVEDFGVKGSPPTHPELLDWLAVEFVESGWSMKHVLRTIVLSDTYRQASRITPRLLEMDDANRWLARGPRLRMDAEMIRDHALAAAGLLSLAQFGPPIRPFQPAGVWTKVGGTAYEYVTSPGDERFRRGIYVVLKRGAPYPSFVNFDASARLACTVQRSRTNTPLQALTLLNDPVYVEAAWGLARRVLEEHPGGDLEGRLRYAFRLCTARQPDARELATLKALHAGQLASYRQQPARARQLLGDQSPPDGISPEEFAAWHAVATALLNLHETITKG